MLMSWYWVSLGCSSQRSDRIVVDTRHILILNTRYWIFEHWILNRLVFEVHKILEVYRSIWWEGGILTSLYLFTTYFFQLLTTFCATLKNPNYFLYSHDFRIKHISLEKWSSWYYWQDLSFSLLFSLDRKVERTCKNVD